MRAREAKKVTLHETEGGSVARLHGELDLSSRPEFEALLIDALVGGSGYFVVDLNHLDFMDSQGIHMLSRIRDLATELDRRFYVDCSGGSCRRVLEAAGADKAFNLKSSREILLEDT